MKKFVYIGFFLIVIGIVFNIYNENCAALDRRAYHEKVNNDIDESYKTVILEVGEIRQGVLKMQSFFVEEPLTLSEVSDSYYQQLVILSNRFVNLERYVLYLSKACDRLSKFSNDKCTSYFDIVTQLKQNYKELIDEYNRVIEEYNYRSGANLKIFEG